MLGGKLLQGLLLRPLLLATAVVTAANNLTSFRRSRNVRGDLLCERHHGAERYRSSRLANPRREAVVEVIGDVAQARVVVEKEIANPLSVARRDNARGGHRRG